MAMNKQDRIDEEVRRSLDLMDELQRVEGNPYLYTRIQARLDRQKEQALPGQSWAPALRWAAFSALMLLNGWFFYQRAGSRADTEIVLRDALSTTYQLEMDASYTYLPGAAAH